MKLNTIIKLHDGHKPSMECVGEDFEILKEVATDYKNHNITHRIHNGICLDCGKPTSNKELI